MKILRFALLSFLLGLSGVSTVFAKACSTYDATVPYNLTTNNNACPPQCGICTTGPGNEVTSEKCVELNDSCLHPKN